MIYGGAAGGGKSFALLLEPMRHYANGAFGGVIFRRTFPEITQEGSLWDTSMLLYPRLNGIPKVGDLSWQFPTGMAMSFAHMQHEKNMLDWQGSQVPYIGFDELTHFTMQQFFYMLSRNRSACGVRPYIRATCNPDPDSWVAKFIAWWIDQNTGYPIKERSGKIRWMARYKGKIHWGDTPAEVEKYCERDLDGNVILPKSVTFIAASIYDNKILLKADPGYLGNLAALPEVEQEQLLKGNWKIKRGAGTYFRRAWFRVLDVLPHGGQVVRYWDRAATEPSPENPDPDYTSGTLMRKYPDGRYVICNIKRVRERPRGVRRLLVTTASQEPDVPICLEKDPGSAGVSEADSLTQDLAGYNVNIRAVTKDKVTRALPLSAQAEAGNVYLLRGDWNEDFLDEAEGFDGSDGKHDDQVDSTSGAFNELTSGANPRIRYVG